MLKPVNDAVRFLVVELGSLAAVAYWGFHEHSGLGAKVLFGVGGPLLIAVVWGIWMAPRASRRAPEGVRALIELVIFGTATAALAASTGAGPAIVFGAIALVNTVLEHVLPAAGPQPRPPS